MSSLSPLGGGGWNSCQNILLCTLTADLFSFLSYSFPFLSFLFGGGVGGGVGGEVVLYL